MGGTAFRHAIRRSGAAGLAFLMLVAAAGAQTPAPAPAPAATQPGATPGATTAPSGAAPSGTAPGAAAPAQATAPSSQVNVPPKTLGDVFWNALVSEIPKIVSALIVLLVTWTVGQSLLA